MSQQDTHATKTLTTKTVGTLAVATTNNAAAAPDGTAARTAGLLRIAAPGLINLKRSNLPLLIA